MKTVLKIGVFLLVALILSADVMLVGQKVIREDILSVQSILSQQNTGVRKKEAPLTLIAVGDIMLGRNVEVLRGRNDNNYPFEHVDSFLKSADFVIGNLEGPIPVTHAITPAGSMRFSFDYGVPSLLYQHNIKLVGIANNHAFDYGAEGYANTAQTLSSAGVVPVGHPLVIGSEYVETRKIGSHKISFLAFNAFDPAFDIKQAESLVKETKEKEKSFVLVNIHWGTEYQTHSNAIQRTIAHALVAAGADAIIGHHPHVSQEIEVYQNKPIFYSLGNFIFDQYFSKETQEGLAVKMTFNKIGVQYELFPYASKKSQPELMDEQTRAVWLEALAKISTVDYKTNIEDGRLNF